MTDTKRIRLAKALCEVVANATAVDRLELDLALEDYRTAWSDPIRGMEPRLRDLLDAIEDGSDAANDDDSDKAGDWVDWIVVKLFALAAALANTDVELVGEASGPVDPPVRCSLCGEADRSKGDHGRGNCVPIFR